MLARACLRNGPPAAIASCSGATGRYTGAQFTCLSSMTEFRIRSGPYAGLETSLAASSFPREVNLMAVLT
jgi:hypothetical protein